MQTATENTITPEAAIADAGLSVSWQFVPFSKSRNAKEKDPSLNWKVTLQRNGRDILTTDYMAGCGHCPAYKNPPKFPTGKPDPYAKQQLIAWECENGKIGLWRYGLSIFAKTTGPLGQIAPNAADVVHSLLMDGDAIDYRDFDDWAANYGYDTDSRQAEKIYRQCVEYGLKLRAALGDAELAKLRAAFADY